TALIAAEGQTEATAVHGVDGDKTGFKTRCHAVRAAEIACPHCSSQTVVDGICDLDRLFFIVEWNNSDDRSKYFLSHDRRRRRHVSQHAGRNPISAGEVLLRWKLSPRRDPCSIARRRFDCSPDTLLLTFADHGTDCTTPIESLTDSQCAGRSQKTVQK